MKQLPDDWRERVLADYMDGCADQEVSRNLKLSTPQFKALLRDNAEFRDIVETGRGYALGWWLHEGRANLRNKTFSYAGWFQNMKNRYGWADKAEVSTTDTSKALESLPTKELEEEVEALLKRMGRKHDNTADKV